MNTWHHGHHMDFLQHMIITAEIKKEKKVLVFNSATITLFRVVLKLKYNTDLE